MILAEITFDLPPMTATELATWVGIFAVVIPVMSAFTIWALGRWFVTHDVFWKQQAQTNEVHEKHLALINDCRNLAVQSDAKSHDLLHAVKGLTTEVSEQKQVTKDNTKATNTLSAKLAFIEGQSTRH